MILMILIVYICYLVVKFGDYFNCLIVTTVCFWLFNGMTCNLLLMWLGKFKNHTLL